MSILSKALVIIEDCLRYEEESTRPPPPPPPCYLRRHHQLRQSDRPTDRPNAFLGFYDTLISSLPLGYKFPLDACTTSPHHTHCDTGKGELGKAIDALIMAEKFFVSLFCSSSPFLKQTSFPPPSHEWRQEVRFRSLTVKVT